MSRFHRLPSKRLMQIPLASYLRSRYGVTVGVACCRRGAEDNMRAESTPTHSPRSRAPLVTQIYLLHPHIAVGRSRFPADLLGFWVENPDLSAAFDLRGSPRFLERRPA